MMKITPKQVERVHRLARELCANCDEDGNCILLDDGEAHHCVQLERMTANYEKEQRELIQAVAEAEQRLGNAEQDNIDLRAFLSIIRKCTDLKELTPELVNRLITKIEVFDSTKDENGKKHVPIKVHFIGVGVIVIPDGKTILETYEEIRKNPPRVA